MKTAYAVFIPSHYELLSGFRTYIMKMAKPFSFENARLSVKVREGDSPFLHLQQLEAVHIYRIKEEFFRGL
ncbi:MAG: hypothetical protein A4E42_00483 [Methanoregulaceae archaeon PtaU1.Bin222]|nr:MAG: hypothetical protein A4E42_00483 [Methanoregulaceae archaeon PtaU1.Bin222]